MNLIKQLILEGNRFYILKGGNRSYESIIDINHSDQKVFLSFADTNERLIFDYEFVNEEILLSNTSDVHYLKNITDDYGSNKILRVIDKQGFIKQIKKSSPFVWTRGSWRNFSYAGLIIRCQGYSMKYSDFGSANYKISIIGNPVYFSPFLKRPCEIDFFFDEVTRFRYYSPQELFPEIKIHERDQFLNYYDYDQMIDFLFGRVYDYFFEHKPYVILNFDEIYESGRLIELNLPSEIMANSFLISIQKMGFYVSE